MTAFTVLSVNLSNRMHSVTTWEQQRTLGAYAAAHRPTVIVCQEARKGLRPPVGYRPYRNTDPGGHEDPIFIRGNTPVSAHYWERAHRGRGGLYPSRFVHSVLVALPGVRPIQVSNVHVNNKIDDAGRPSGRYPHWPDANRHLAVAAAIAHRGGLSMVFGDWNIDARTDRAVKHPAFPTARFAAVGMVEAVTPRGTHGRRRIDRGFYTPSARLGPNDVRVLAKGIRYDHHPVLFAFTVAA